MLLTIDKTAARYMLTRASAIIHMAVVDDFGVRYAEEKVKRVMKPQQEEPEPINDEFYR